MGEVSQNDARRITELFENHLNESLYRLVLLENQHYRLARDWISRFDLPLRTLDALHLAVCSINNFSLVTADDKLAQSATILGIDILLLTSKKHPNAKPLHGFSGAGVLEIVDDFDGDTYRAIYTVKFESVIYLLHSFQKKSKHGIATPKQDIELVKKRLKIAQENYLQQTTEKME
jgi:phage-related protein